MMIDKNLLVAIIRDKGLKIGFISEKLGMSRRAWYDKIDGKTPFSQSEKDKMQEILNLSDEQMSKIFG